MAKKYKPNEIEKKWQKVWQEKDFYRTADKVSGRKNFYTLVSNRYRSNLILTRKYSNKIEFFIIRVLVLFGLLLRFFISIFKSYSGMREKKERMRAYLSSFFMWLGIKKISSGKQLQN